MTTFYAPITRSQHERGGLVIEASLAGDAAITGALERAVGVSLAEMGRPEETAGRLLSVVKCGGRIVLHALITGVRAAALAAEQVYKGLDCQISLLGNEISEIVLVDRPLSKSSWAAPQQLAVLYKRNDEMGSISRALQKTAIRPTSAEIQAAWEKMTPDERAMAATKASLAAPVSGGRDFLRWYAERANKGSGNPIRSGGQFW